MKSVFNTADASEIISRINKLNKNTQPLWGTMNVAQMLAHCNVTYELVYDNKYKRPGKFAKFLLKLFVKQTVVGPKPYQRNTKTAPVFLIKGNKNFDEEKNRLITYVNKTHQLGEAYFDGRESHSFGVLTKVEWNVMFYKHLDHHLQQFGV